MGRLKRQVPCGKCRLRTNGKKVEPNKTYSVEYEYTWNGKILRKSTGVSCKASQWNPKGKGELLRGYGTNYQEVNAILHRHLTRIDTSLMEYNEKHPNGITADVISAFLSDKPVTRKDGGRDFAEYALERLESRHSRKKIGHSRYKNGKSALNIFAQFLVSCQLGTYKPDGIYIGEISSELLQKHIDWRRTVKKNGDKTINHSLTPLLQACNDACDMGYIDSTTNARIQDMRIEVKPNRDEDEREFDDKYLTKEQIQELISIYEGCTEPRRKEFIEMFLFAFHACGLRVVDVMTLKWSNIDFEKKELKKVIIKNNKRHTIPLTSAAITILQRWKIKARRNKFVFDLVADDLDVNDDEALYKARNNATKCIDQSLVVVGEQMNLPFKLTMHVARHSFAVAALNDGTNMSVVSRLLGHSSTDVTEKVYAKFLPETLADEVERLNYNFLPSFD
ncbi:MAG: tyrosine-type recombinase/integrase [Prevotella sp.]|nr:tyrosine-type recombinase/integrase [Prevotella sp.]